MKLIIILFGLIVILSYTGMIYMHEQVHVEIFDSYGIESEVKMFSWEYFPDAVTVSEPITKEACPDSCTLAHNMNDAVGYNLEGIFFVVAFGLFLTIGFLERGMNPKIVVVNEGRVGI